jgi:predicted deacylase
LCGVSANGSPTEAIAFYFDRDILPRADLYLDLHSAGVKCAMPTLVGYHEPDTAARDAALVFGAPYVWCHPTVAAGRTVSAAIARGIPALYAEARGAGRIDPGDLLCYRRGIDNLMRHLAILPGEPEIPWALQPPAMTNPPRRRLGPMMKRPSGVKVGEQLSAPSGGE